MVDDFTGARTKVVWDVHGAGSKLSQISEIRTAIEWIRVRRQISGFCGIARCVEERRQRGDSEGNEGILKRFAYNHNVLGVGFIVFS